MLYLQCTPPYQNCSRNIYNHLCWRRCVILIPNHNYAVYKTERALTHLAYSLAQYISINPDRKDGLIFSYHSKFQPSHYRLGNQEIAFSNNIIYLGVTLDKHLTYSCPLKRRVKSLRKLLRANTLSIWLKLLLFQIRPALLYGSPLYR